jgi:hypothetical protein
LALRRNRMAAVAAWAFLGLVAAPLPAAPKARSPASSSAPTSAKAAASPRVEIYVPSMAALASQAKKSHAARLYEALAPAFPLPEDETGEGFDLQALLAFLRDIATWPDSSLALAIYTQDRDGRPRWAAAVDWPLDDVIRRLRRLLESESAARLVKDIRLVRDKDANWRLELPDVLLAVFRESGRGSLIASAADVRPPQRIFGRRSGGKDAGSLVYCLLNLEAGEEEERGGTLFGMVSGVKDIRYAASVTTEGLWRERFNLRWNPFMGMALKTALKKVNRHFSCPKDAFLRGAVHLDLGAGLADLLTGLQPGTIGRRAGPEMAVAIVPPAGFAPVPDVYYQFPLARREKVIQTIRKAIARDADKRKEDDRPPAWHEETIDDQPVFWHDDSADNASAVSIVRFRTAVFFDADGDDQRLVVAGTAQWPEDAVRRWRDLRARPSAWVRVPSAGATAAWETTISWKHLYALAQPYLTLMAGLSEGKGAPPEADELADVLADSVIALQIQYAGVDARHNGPLPLGAAYLPLVAAAALGATGDPDSEAVREQTACRNLRVLHHHARLFRKDYGRWPANVAELDGYVDFSSHPHLLSLRRRDLGFAGNLASLFSARQERIRQEGGEQVVDDSLYRIEWSPDAWRLSFRDGQFQQHRTIYIDQEGEIHRVPLDAPASRPSAPAREAPAAADEADSENTAEAGR